MNSEYILIYNKENNINIVEIIRERLNYIKDLDKEENINIFLMTYHILLYADDYPNLIISKKEYDYLKSKIIHLFNTKRVVNFEISFENIDYIYIPTFFEIILKYGIKFNINRFKLLIAEKKYLLNIVFKNKLFSEKYKNLSKELILNDIKSIEIIIDKFLISNKYYIPYLSKEEINRHINLYLDSDVCNYNYVRLIRNSKINNEFNIDAKTRVKAKRVLEKQRNSSTKIKLYGYSMQISSSNKFDKIKNIEIDNESKVINITYNLERVINNGDQLDILYTLAYIFEFLDYSNCISLINKNDIQDSLLDIISGIRAKDEYIDNYIFNQKQVFALSSLIFLDYKLLINNKRFEDILSNIYTEKFSELFKYPSNSRFLTINKYSSYVEKIRAIAPEFESILKQYKTFVEEGFIDFEIIEETSQPVPIKDVKSLVENKYIILNNSNDRTKRIVEILFSRSQILTINKQIKNSKAKNLYIFLLYNNVNINDYSDWQKEPLNYLENNEFIQIDIDGNIKLSSVDKISILEYLYENKCLSLYHFDNKVKELIFELKNDEFVVFENTLFSSFEISYFNYYLNKSESSNGFDLRNKYLHGSQKDVENEEYHKLNYYRYLLLISLLILKICDDLLIKKFRDSVNFSD